MAAQAHRSDPRILGRRTLERDFRVLAEMLQPEMSVLDVGCGTGAITAGIAKAVSPGDRVVGVDRDAVLVDAARAEQGGLAGLEFVYGDVVAGLPYMSEFDVVASARTLQWIASPLDAVRNMMRAARRGGLLVVLDYSHRRNAWEPEPPGEFLRFYAAFLAWREANGWDNRMGERLAELFRAAGLVDVQVMTQDEVTSRGDADFLARAALWGEVIGNVHAQLVTCGYCSEQELDRARKRYEAWVESSLGRQTLAMNAAIGLVP